MNIKAIRRLTASLTLTVPVAMTGCGDPCLDDGAHPRGEACAAVPGVDADPSPDEDDGLVPDQDPSARFCRDADADGFGDPADCTSADPMDPPSGHVPADAGDDCDDRDPHAFPGAAEVEDGRACMRDADEDGWGDGDPGPGVERGLDCDDGNDHTHPGAAENELPGECTNDDDEDGWGDDDPGLGIRAGTDCADEDPELYACDTLWCVDDDGDGFGDPTDCMPGGPRPPTADHVDNDDDCADDDPAVRPGAASQEPRLCTRDADGDGWGDASGPEGADQGSDCADGNAAVFPGAATEEPHLCTIDGDGDGWGDRAASALEALADDGSDCLDNDAAVHPGAAAQEPALCTADADGDGYGTNLPPLGADPGTDCLDISADAFPGASPNEPEPIASACTLDADGDDFGDVAPGPGVISGTDCDDGSDQTFPGAAEAESPSACMADEDLDGYGESSPPEGVTAGVDCQDANAAITVCDQWCTDADGDGFGDPASCVLSGGSPGMGWANNDTDCVDTDGAIWPGAASEEPALCTIDDDGDGWGDLLAAAAHPGADAGSDCDDASIYAFPHAGENEAPPLDQACVSDEDEDGYGDVVAPPNGLAGTDCVDSSAVVYPGAASEEPSLCTLDADADGYGDAQAPLAYAGADAGTDCDDASAYAFPGASPNEVTPLDQACTLDADGDDFGDSDPPEGTMAGTDCDDEVSTTHPGAAEDESAQACMADADGDGYGDSSPPEGVIPGVDCADDDAMIAECTLWCMDADGDGFGGGTCELSEGSPGMGWVNNSADCADLDGGIFPGAAEQEPTLCAEDEDDDGWGDSAPPAGVDAGSDCLDDDASGFPGASPAEPGPAATLCTLDADGDDFGDIDPPAGVVPGTDCHDDSAAVAPGAAMAEPTLCTIDGDGDGHGDASATATYPDADDGSDCADYDPNILPGASPNELPPLSLACTEDQDGDDYGDADPPAGVVAGTDCDDGSDTTFPGAAEIESPLACMADADGDGWGAIDPPAGVTSGQDCDDADAGINACDQWCADIDGDGFGSPSACIYTNVDPGPGFVNNASDCVDASAAIFPGAAVNEPELCTLDGDGDGWGTSAPPVGAEAGSDCVDGDGQFRPGAASQEPTLCTIDADGDGWGDSSASAIEPQADDGSDCVDDDAQFRPGAASQEPALCTVDADGDGWGDSSASAIEPQADDGSDCADASPAIYPAAAFLEPMLCAVDADGDGWGSTMPPAGVDAGNDCDDGSSEVYPGSAVNDPGVCAIDADGDGYGDSNPPAGIEPGSDCNDGQAQAYPGSAEDDSSEACMLDGDGDGYGDTMPGAGIDAGSDCDDTNPALADCTCEAPTTYLTCDGTPEAPTADPYHAIGADCSPDPTQSVVLQSSTFEPVDDGSWEIFNRFGTAPDPFVPSVGLWSPRPYVVNADNAENTGNNLLMLSTGVISSPSAIGQIIEAAGQQDFNGTNGNPDLGQFQAPINPGLGSDFGTGGTPFMNCDGTNDCSDSLAGLQLVTNGLSLNDRAQFQMVATVPDGVDGFRFDFAYFSAEYPEYVDTAFNDIFVVWVESTNFTGNIAVTPDGTPFTVTELATAGEMTIFGGDPRLEGTGFEGHGATGWRSILAPAVPGETLTVTFFLADVADDAFATTVLIDNFRWDCAGCIEIGDCGLTTLY